ncbi:alpha/beta hydrolase [Modestobacter sp. VKM Ac-2979]|uniref:alpha/beta fold hydrolase n=1 Tax=unclassified Modestobacter TaxID=2643866 RepID=UPI0022AB8767|nr:MULTISPECIES: alpha/beta hydrolase [unclassified Modestobacter]MCZ2813560.1 alpha/beta hydrolase [Modestobacter sp. VKM Ac-2979]MCZ2842248.1 alpha/beta hydrolase [Modestobacter sp. VKM Ac-2980]
MSYVVSFDATVLTLQIQGPDDGPVVVLVNGLGMTTDSWGRVPELLADRHRVVRYDLRGHGRSGNAPADEYSLEAHAQDLATVLAEVVPDGQQAVVVGNSLGGGIIIVHARDLGLDRIAGVVFAGSGGSGVTFAGFPADGLPPMARRIVRRSWLKALRLVAVVANRVRPFEPLADRLVRKFAFEPGAPEAAVAQVREDFMGSRRVPLARTTLASVSTNGVRYASALTVPTLVLHGEHDPEVPQQEIDELMPELADGELVQLPGAGHMVALTRTEETAEQIARWVRRVRAG